MSQHPKSLKGFSLAELLLSMLILGIVATFTIPKVLLAQRGGQNKAITKEAIATIASAYHNYKLTNSVSASTNPTSLTPYLNYVKFDSTTTVDGAPNDAASYNCGSASWAKCFRLHSGGILIFDDAPFGGTASNRFVWFLFDPDGKFTGSSSEKSIWLALYFNGRITSYGNLASGSQSAGGTVYGNPNIANDPTWFSW